MSPLQMLNVKVCTEVKRAAMRGLALLRIPLRTIARTIRTVQFGAIRNRVASGRWETEDGRQKVEPSENEKAKRGS
jgi:hypothetical protein